MYPFQHKILNVLHVLPTVVHACSWLTAAVRLNIAFVLSYPQHLTTYYQLLPSQKNIYKTSERHVHNGDIAPPLYIEQYRYYVNDYSTKIIQSSKPSS